MITEKLTQFAEAVSVRLYVKRPAPMEQDWRLDNWLMPCFVALPNAESEIVQETSGRVERRDFELMALRSVDVTFDTSEADASTEIARTDVLDFAQQLRGVFHVEQLGGRQIWDSANGELIVGWSLRLRLTELVGESACGGEPDPSEIEITENGTYNVLPFGRAVVDVQGGSPAVIEPLSVTPDYDPHTFTPSAGVDGFAPVVVGACPVCPAPVVEALQVTPTTAPQTLTPSAGVDGYNPVSVSAVDASIDANIQPGNIKQGVDILGVTGTMEPMPPTPQGAIYDVLLGDGTTQTVQTGDQSTTINNTNNFLANSSTRYESAYITTIGTQAFYSRNVCREIVTPDCTTITGGSNFRSSAITRIHVGTLTSFAHPFWSGINTNLRLFEVGQGTAVNLPCGGWTATNVIAEGQSGIDELNYNIKTYIADKVADRTGDSALTITFGASLYNVLTPATIATFTAKNWNVASA